MKKIILAMAVAIALAGNVSANDDHDKKSDSDRSEFKPDTLLLSRSVYSGDASIVTVGQILPPNCPSTNTKSFTVNVPVLPADGGGTTAVKESCSKATDDGTYPTVFNNDNADGSFGVTSPIFLDNITTDGWLLGTLPVPTDLIVTSFSSKSELALNRSLDKKSITFMGYVGGQGFTTGPNQLDVSNSNTPGVIDPTNPAVSQYYRSVAEVDSHGHVFITDGNAYSGNNGRAAIKGDWLYYMTGNDNNGGLKVTSSLDQLNDTQVGLNLLGSNGAELLIPGQAPPVPPGMPITKIGDFEINQVDNPATCSPGPCVKYVLDKPGKDNNFRGLTIFDHTLFVTKGSGGNGINTVYQVGNTGSLPTGDETALNKLPITVLPGFPTTLASDGTTAMYPFGIWFADAHTLYVADEGDGCASNGSAPCADVLATGTPAAISATVYAHAKNQTGAGLQKWVFDSATSTWNLAYTIQTGLNLGTPYSVPDNPGVVPNYPAPTDVNAVTSLLWGPAMDGLRNITGRVNDDGTATIWAITSTVSGSGDQGADPNQLVKVTDRIDATTLPKGDGDHDRDDSLDCFKIIRSAKSGEVFRGVAFAPQDHEGHEHDGHDHDDDGGR